jgi:hypothetical protein
MTVRANDPPAMDYKRPWHLETIPLQFPDPVPA